MCSRPFIAKIFAEMYAMMFGCGGTFSLKKVPLIFGLGAITWVGSKVCLKKWLKDVVRKWGPLKKFNLRSKSGYGFAVLLSNFARTFILQLFPAQLIMTGKN